MISSAYKAARLVWRRGAAAWHALATRWTFLTENVRHGSFTARGVPFVSVARGAVCVLGERVALNSELSANPIGRSGRCILFVDRGAELRIGNDVGMSGCAIVARRRVSIGDRTKLGGGTCIYDTDFHSLDPVHRREDASDREHTAHKPVEIGSDVFIGAHSTILKGVKIGDRSIVGACSVVTRDIPPDEIWAGNPARMLRKVGA